MKKAGMKLRTDLRETPTVKKIAERIKRTVKSQPTGGAGLSVGRARRWLGSMLGLAKFSKFSKILQIFGGLVLGFIKTKFCKKIIKKCV